MDKFKKGDRVRRVNGSFNNAVEGHEYTVAEAQSHSLILDGVRGSYDPVNFELAAPAAPKAFHYRRYGGGTGMSRQFDTAQEAAEMIRAFGAVGIEFEIVEVSVVQTVTPRRTLEVKQ